MYFSLIGFSRQQPVAKKATDTLRAVTILDFKPDDFRLGQIKNHMDSTVLMQHLGFSLGESIQRSGLILVRNSGQGTVSSPAIRGTGASHTAVLWNGLPVISSLTGQADLNLLEVAGLGEVDIVKGGGTSLYGSGAIGGTIAIHSMPILDGTNINSSSLFGSFGLFQQQFAFSKKFLGKGQFKTQTQLYYKTHQNDFTFLNTSKFKPSEERRQNANYKRVGFTQSNSINIPRLGTLSLHWMTQQGKTNIPGPWSLSNPQDNQEDLQSNAVLKLKTSHPRWQLENKIGYQLHKLHYRNPANNFEAKNDFQKLLFGSHYFYSLSQKSTIILGLQLQKDFADVDAFKTTKNLALKTRYQQSLYGGIRQTIGKKIKTALNIRLEKNENFSTPIAGDFGLEYQIFERLKLQGSINRSYRLPTLNDLFWSGAGAKGNKDLKPEYGWNYEFGFELKPTKKHSKITVQGYSNYITNWIAWQPLSNQNNIWMPQNLQAVWARGIDINASYKRKIRQVDLLLNAIYNYNLSTQEEGNNNSILGNQLVYVPKHRVHFSWILALPKKFGFNGFVNYRSRQFNDLSNTVIDQVDQYTTVDLVFSKAIHWSKHLFVCAIKINNVTNKKYFYQLGYPAIGRNYSININYKLKTK